MANLSELEEHLLHRLASATVTRSSVALAAELWDGDNSPFTFDMVHWVLKDMNERGYVTYFISGFAEIPVQIRVTDVGYDLLGYGQRHAILQGTRRRYNAEDVMRPGDLTDFRNHREHAEWSSCERLSIEEHRKTYPDHPHSPEWGYEENDMTTATGATSPGLGARSAGGEEIRRIMAERGITERSAREIFRQRQADEITAKYPVPANQKQKILANLLSQGKAQTVHDLRLRVQRDGHVIDAHNLIHVLWAMNKDQHITFRQSKRSPVAWEGDLTAIRLTTVGEVAAKRINPTTAEIMKRGQAAMDEVRANNVIDVRPLRPQIIEQAKQDAPYQPLTDSELPVEEVPHFEAEKVDNKGTYQFVPETPAQPEPPITFFSEYPLIGKMLNRQSRIEQAAKILEEEGELDLAAQTLEKVTYTDFEKEVLRLVKQIPS